jgi:heme/copper-type cytochrome/quinol oxidase subunit 3
MARKGRLAKRWMISKFIFYALTFFGVVFASYRATRTARPGGIRDGQAVDIEIATKELIAR